MNSLYFINEKGILTSTHGLEVQGIKAYNPKNEKPNLWSLLFKTF